MDVPLYVLTIVPLVMGHGDYLAVGLVSIIFRDEDVVTMDPVGGLSEMGEGVG